MSLIEMRVSYAKIFADRKKFSKYVVRTPLIRLPWLDTDHRTVWAKLENNQETGSFKFRGAFRAVANAPRDRNIITASAGNHGLAIASVCKKLGRNCIVYVPANASEVKITRLQNMGANVTLHGRDLQEASDQALQ